MMSSQTKTAEGQYSSNAPRHFAVCRTPARRVCHFCIGRALHGSPSSNLKMIAVRKRQLGNGKMVHVGEDKCRSRRSHPLVGRYYMLVALRTVSPSTCPMPASLTSES